MEFPEDTLCPFTTSEVDPSLGRVHQASEAAPSFGCVQCTLYTVHCTLYGPVRIQYRPDRSRPSVAVSDQSRPAAQWPGESQRPVSVVRPIASMTGGGRQVGHEARGPPPPFSV
eukprot:1314288-Pyramimonas_sp.AAC.2